MLDKLYKKYNREELIKITGIIGILVNFIFAITKFIVGTASNSVAIISDAVNNLTDGISSVITLIGLKLAEKKPDKKHPFGYGRMEYLSGMIVSIILAITGIEFIVTSISRIRNPELTNFTIIQIVLLVVFLFGKLFISKLNTSVGKKTDSASLEASGADAMADVMISALTIVSAGISYFTKISIDGYIGFILAIYIIYEGVKLIRQTTSRILGERASKKLVNTIRNELKEYEQILGSYDFVIHSYGPIVKVATANLEFKDTMKVEEAFEVMDSAQQKILKNQNIYFTFGLYSVNTYNNEVKKIEKTIEKIVLDMPNVISYHGFYVNTKSKRIRFDVVVDYSLNNFNILREEMTEKILKIYPEYSIELFINLDYD